MIVIRLAKLIADSGKTVPTSPVNQSKLTFNTWAIFLPSIYGIAGHIYFISALILSSLYLILTLKFVLSKKPNGVFLFFYSVLYIALLFSVMVFDMRR